MTALAASNSSDSFFIIVDDGSPQAISPQADSQWRARQVAAFLAGGEHVITIAAREPSRIDCLRLLEGQAKKTLHQMPLESPEPDGRRPVAINPPTFRWLTFGQPPYTVELGRKEDLSDARRLTAVRETFLRPFEPLEPGRYYWRVTAADGKVKSESVSFEVGKDVARWPIASWDEALAKAPKGRPRMLMRPEDLPRLRQLAAGECKEVVEKAARWAGGVVGKPIPEEPKKAQGLSDQKAKVMRRVFGKNFASAVASTIESLCVLHLLAPKPEYAAEIRRRALAAVALDPKGDTSHGVSDFANGTIAVNLAWAYDALYDQWSAEEREKLQTAILERCRQGFSVYKPKREQALFDAHGWQHVIQDVTLAALALYHESPEAKEWFDWSFKMHVALYPWYGGADGGSAECAGYYEGTNMLQSIKAAAILEAATGVSLFGNPWYRNTPYFLIYSHGLGSARSQFGDGGEGSPAAGAPQKLAAMLWARKLKDPYVAAYAAAIPTSTIGGAADFLRLLWHPLNPPQPKALTDLPKARLLADVGVVLMRSALTQPQDDIFFELRSCPYGSHGHAHADQNSFNLIAFGERLVVDSGYYQSFGDEHHYGWTVTTRAHNTILIGGKGQASRNVEAFGQIVDFQVGDGCVRAVGSCPNAYHDVKVERFDRHVLWLQPDVFLIADDLKTAEPQHFQWLLHSAEQMRASGNTVELAVGKAEGRLTFFEPSALQFEQTDKFAVPVEGWRPDRKNRDYPDQWHLTASTAKPATAQRFVSGLQVCRKGDAAKLPKADVQQDARGVTLVLPDGRKGRVEWRGDERK